MFNITSALIKHRHLRFVVVKTHNSETGPAKLYDKGEAKRSLVR